MTEFTDLSLTKDVEDMSEAEAKETLSDFVSEHESNQSAYDEMKTEYEEKIDAREERVEDLEARVEEWREEKAAEAAEYVQMPSGLLADKFSIDELEQIIDEGAEFEQEAEEEDEKEEEPLTTFTEKPEKGKEEGSGFSEDVEKRARQRLAERGFPLSN